MKTTVILLAGLALALIYHGIASINDGVFYLGLLILVVDAAIFVYCLLIEPFDGEEHYDISAYRYPSELED